MTGELKAATDRVLTAWKRLHALYVEWPPIRTPDDFERFRQARRRILEEYRGARFAEAALLGQPTRITSLQLRQADAFETPLSASEERELADYYAQRERERQDSDAELRARQAEIERAIAAPRRGGE